MTKKPEIESEDKAEEILDALALLAEYHILSIRQYESYNAQVVRRFGVDERRRKREARKAEIAELEAQGLDPTK